jgi:hypothetical protein
LKTVISASRRTDIPAFYLKWFIQRIKEGEVTVRNPYYKKKATRVDLNPDSVEWIVFWSRNYAHFLKERAFFSSYHLFFHFTVVSYHPVLEKNSLVQHKAIDQMEQLVKYYGPERIIWRYDPIVIWRDRGKINTNYNRENFKQLCKFFSELGIMHCYFSYVTDYLKFKRRFYEKYNSFDILSVEENQSKFILEELKEITTINNMQLYSCCNDALNGDQILKGSCISGHLLNALRHQKTVSEARTPTRKECGCTRSIDIGDYSQQPCYYGCIYCYANPVWE